MNKRFMKSRGSTAKFKLGVDDCSLKDDEAVIFHSNHNQSRDNNAYLMLLSKIQALRYGEKM